jgi:hypothetical protein
VYELVDTCGVYEHVDVIYMCYLLLHVILSYIYIDTKMHPGAFCIANAQTLRLQLRS